VADEGPRRDPGVSPPGMEEPPPGDVHAGQATPRVGEGAPPLPAVGEDAAARSLDADPRRGRGSHRGRPLVRMI
jgi:hypothetical protein